MSKEDQAGSEMIQVPQTELMRIWDKLDAIDSYLDSLAESLAALAATDAGIGGLVDPVNVTIHSPAMKALREQLIDGGFTRREAKGEILKLIKILRAGKEIPKSIQTPKGELQLTVQEVGKK